MTKSEKDTGGETIEVVIERDYWPMAKVDAIRGSDVVTIDINMTGPVDGTDSRLRVGDIVKLPKKEAAKLINSGSAKMPEME